MSNTILLKRSDIANSVPAAGNLLPGEMALNFTDGNLFFKDSSNEVVLLTSTQFVDVPGNVTANFFIGNGSQLTGINVDATKIANGTTEVQAFEDGNVSFTISNISNVVVVTGNSIIINGNVDSGNVNTTSAVVSGNIKFLDSVSNYAGFEAPASITESVIYKLPPADGNINNALVTDGAGNLSWKSILSGLLPVGTRDSGIINVTTFDGFLTVVTRDGNVLVPV